MILHKLIEEVLTGETAERLQALQARAAELMSHLGLDDVSDPEDGPSSTEMAETVERTLQLPAIAGNTSAIAAGISDLCESRRKRHSDLDGGHCRCGRR